MSLNGAPALNLDAPAPAAAAAPVAHQPIGHKHIWNGLLIAGLTLWGIGGWFQYFNFFYVGSLMLGASAVSGGVALKRHANPSFSSLWKISASLALTGLFTLFNASFLNYFHYGFTGALLVTAAAIGGSTHLSAFYRLPEINLWENYFKPFISKHRFAALSASIGLLSLNPYLSILMTGVGLGIERTQSARLQRSQQFLLSLLNPQHVVNYYQSAQQFARTQPLKTARFVIGTMVGLATFNLFSPLLMPLTTAINYITFWSLNALGSIFSYGFSGGSVIASFFIATAYTLNLATYLLPMVAFGTAGAYYGDKLVVGIKNKTLAARQAGQQKYEITKQAVQQKYAETKQTVQQKYAVAKQAIQQKYAIAKQTGQQQLAWGQQEYLAAKQKVQQRTAPLQQKYGAAKQAVIQYCQPLLQTAKQRASAIANWLVAKTPAPIKQAIARKIVLPVQALLNANANADQPIAQPAAAVPPVQARNPEFSENEEESEDAEVLEMRSSHKDSEELSEDPSQDSDSEAKEAATTPALSPAGSNTPASSDDEINQPKAAPIAHQKANHAAAQAATGRQASPAAAPQVAAPSRRTSPRFSGNAARL